MFMKIIGLVGKRGVGKSELRKYVIEKYGYPYTCLTSRDIVRFYGLQRGLIDETTVLTRRKSGEIRIRLEEEYGGEFIARQIVKLVRKTLGVIIIDSIWRSEELNLYKQALGKSLLLIGVLANEKTRYERLVRIKEEKSYEQFKKWGNIVNESQIGGLLKEVGYIIGNNSSKEVFYEEIDSLVKFLIPKNPINS